MSFWELLLISANAAWTQHETFRPLCTAGRTSIVDPSTKNVFSFDKQFHSVQKRTWQCFNNKHFYYFQHNLFDNTYIDCIRKLTQTSNLKIRTTTHRFSTVLAWERRMLWRISSWPRRRWRSWNLRVWWWRTVTPQQILKIKWRFLAPCHTFSIFFFQITKRCPMKSARFLTLTTYWSCALLSRRTTITPTGATASSCWSHILLENTFIFHKIINSYNYNANINYYSNTNAPIATLIRLQFTLGGNKYTYIKTTFEINL